MTVVSFNNPVVTFNQALSEFLRDYFDGATHQISDFDLEFPIAEIRIDGRVITGEITTSIIAVTGLGSIDFRKYKCNNPNVDNLPGYELWATVLRNVSVVVPIHGGEDTKNNRQAHFIWGLLYALLTSKTNELSAKNIFKCELPPVPEDILDQDQTDIAHASGLLTCEIHLQFASYNLSEVP